MRVECDLGKLFFNIFLGGDKDMIIVYLNKYISVDGYLLL